MKQTSEKKKKGYSSIFYMILIINLCSIIVLSIFNYYVFHRLSGKAYLDSFLKYNERVTQLAFNNIDKQIMQLILKISQLHFSDIRENEPLLIAQEEELARYPEKVQALSTEMKKIQKTYPYIFNIDIYYQGTNTIVTGFDKVHFLSDNSRLDQYLPWYQGYQAGEQKDGFFYIPDGIYLMEEPVISYIKNISMPKWGNKSIILSISIHPKSFTEYIELKEGDFSILTRDQTLLYDSAGQDAGQQKLTTLENMAWKNETESTSTSGYHELHSAQGDMTVFHSVSSITGLTYLYSVDTARFYEDYNLTSKMFLINFFISIAFNLIVLLVISYYNYTTYRKKVLVLSEEAGITMDSSAKSFEGSLNILTSKITDLHEEVQSSRGMVFQNTVRSLILNRNIEDCFKELALYLNGNMVCCYIIELSSIQEIEPLQIERLQENFQPCMEFYDVLFTTIETDTLVGLLIYKSDHLVKASNDFLNKFYNYWQSCPMISGKSFCLTDGGVSKSYDSAKEIRRYRYLMPREIYLSYEIIQSKERKESGSHLKLFEAVRKDINTEDLLQLKLHLEMIVESFKNGNYGIEYCMSTLRDLVTLFYQIMQQHQLDMWVVFGYDIREYYKKIANIEMFQNWCDILAEMILKSIHQKKMSVDDDIRTQLMNLVDKNLEKNITLDFLAEKLNMRSDATSRIFRQTMGIGYSEYIKTRKLERALELIDQGCSVKEVAEILGYSTSQYFIKVFKENYGVTPYQHKKKTEQEKNQPFKE